MSRHIFFRFDVSGLEDAEVDGLVGEVLVQGESSDTHPSVAGTSFDSADVGARVRTALERANLKADLALNDADLALCQTEVCAILHGRPSRIDLDAPALVANVFFDADGDARDLLRTVMQGETRFEPYIELYDRSDPDDGPLYLMYGVEGGGATVFAPDCPSGSELERRLVRFFGDSGWTIDDHQDATFDGTVVELAYAVGEGCGGLDADGVRQLVRLSREAERAP